MADVAAGRSILVVAYFDADASRPKRVCLEVGVGAEARLGLASVLGQAPYRVFDVRAVQTTLIDRHAFSVVSGGSADGRRWELAVPRIDVPLIRRVLL